MGVRKNQSTLTANEKSRLVAAILQLKANGTYDQYVTQHRDAMRSSMMPAHGGPAFFPWHREFLRRYELDLQAIDSSVTLPYWDWTVDRTAQASLWSADFMGGNGEAGTRRVTTGAFAFSRGNWTITVRASQDVGPALRRELGAGASLPSLSQVNAALGTTPYDRFPWMDQTNSFRGALEAIVHNPVHGWVGGNMAWGASPNDPVFFLHHCNVDRLWALWQDQHPSEVPYLPTVGGMQGHNLNDPMSPWGGRTTPASVVDHTALGYTYDSDVAPASALTDLTVGAPPAQAMIGAAGEIDTYRFQIASAGAYVIETSGQTDVVMSLLGPNNANALVTEDDDNGVDRNARIVSNLTAGTYFVRVRHYDPSSMGSYGVAVRRQAAAAVPEIPVNGATVAGNIEVANESDLYTFSAVSAAIYRIGTTGSTDTFLTLYGPNDQARLIAQDDDSGPGTNSLVAADLAPGVYFVRVRHYEPQGTGRYRISVKR